VIQISIKTNFPQVQKRLDDMRADLATKTTARTINKVMDLAKTAMSREIRSDYALSAAYVRDRLRITRATTRLGRFGISAKLTGSGKRGAQRSANVIAFSGRQGLKGVSVKIRRKGARKVIKHAFIGNKGRTVFIRTSKSRLPIKPVQTIDIPQMFNTRRINAAVRKLMVDRFVDVFEREAAFVIRSQQ